MFGPKKVALVLTFSLAGLALAACGDLQAAPTPTVDTEDSKGTEADAEPGLVLIANPASVYCEGLGYMLEIRSDEEGNQYGVCIFPGETECEEWDFLAGRCGQEHSYCVQQGGMLEEDGNVGTCAFPDGSSCMEIEFFNGDCGPASGATGGGGESGPVEEETPLAGGGETLYSVPVVGWLGYVLSTPDGAQYDDYVVLMPEGAGECGVAGATDEVGAEIAGLRDKEEPGKYANFWGTLIYDMPDYGNCQIVAYQVRYGAVASGPDPVEGWEGTIVSLEPGAPFDDAFVLAGDYPVQFGIASAIGTDGQPAYTEAIATLRDTGAAVIIYGQMLCGVPDSNGCQIQVERLVADGVEVMLDPAV